jgi:hypothetical protein
MARATRASGERNPKAIRVSSRSFVLTDSTRAFDSEPSAKFRTVVFGLSTLRCSLYARLLLPRWGFDTRGRSAAFSDCTVVRCSG